MDTAQINEEGLRLIREEKIEEFNNLRRAHPEWKPRYQKTVFGSYGGKGLNLASINLSESNLDESYFMNCNLDSANFMESSLQRAIFAGAIASRANFFLCNLFQADFASAVLDCACFSHSNINEVDFVNANLSHADLEGANCEYSDFGNANFHNVNVSRTNFMFAVFSGVKDILSAKNLHAANFACAIGLSQIAKSFAQAIMEQLRESWSRSDDDAWKLQRVKHDWF